MTLVAICELESGDAGQAFNAAVRSVAVLALLEADGYARGDLVADEDALVVDANFPRCAVGHEGIAKRGFDTGLFRGVSCAIVAGERGHEQRENGDEEAGVGHEG